MCTLRFDIQVLSSLDHNLNHMQTSGYTHITNKFQAGKFLSELGLPLFINIKIALELLPKATWI